MSGWQGSGSEDLHPPGELLSAHLDGELAEGEDVLVEAHIASCPACRSELAAISVVRAAVQSMPAPPLDADYEDKLIERTLAAVEDDEPEVMAPPQSLTGDNVVRLRRRMALAAAGVAAALVVGVAVTASSDAPATPQVAHMVDSHVTASAGFDPTRLAPLAVPATLGGP